MCRQIHSIFSRPKLCIVVFFYLFKVFVFIFQVQNELLIRANHSNWINFEKILLKLWFIDLFIKSQQSTTGFFFNNEESHFDFLTAWNTLRQSKSVDHFVRINFSRLKNWIWKVRLKRKEKNIYIRCSVPCVKKEKQIIYRQYKTGQIRQPLCCLWSWNKFSRWKIIWWLHWYLKKCNIFNSY